MVETRRNVTRLVTDITGLRLLVWVMVAAWFLQSVLSDPYGMGVGMDYGYFVRHYTTAFTTWMHYHQMPLWDPYSCGGVVVPGNVQNPVWGPSIIPVLLLGVLPGMRIAHLLFFVAGMEGAYRYARHLGIQGAGAVTTALAFALSGRFVQAFHDGQPVFLTFLLAPWALLCLEKGFRSWWWVVAGGAVMGVVLLEGGAVPLPFISLALLIFTVVHTLALWVREDPEVHWYRPALTLAAMAALAALMTAFRFLPVLETLKTSPRVWLGEDTYSVKHILLMLFDANEDLFHQGVGTAYVGHLAAAAALLAVFLHDRRLLIPVICGLLLFDLSLGSADGLGLFPLVKKLPVLTNMRNPYRATVLLAFIVAVGAGAGVSMVEGLLLELRERTRDQGRWTRMLGGLQGVTVALVAATLAFMIVKDVTDFTREGLADVHVRRSALTMTQPFRQSLGNRWDAHVWPAAGLGSLSCFEEQPLFQSPALRGDLPEEEYLAPGSKGTVTRVGWSPLRIVLDVDLQGPGTVLVNQNYRRGWRSSVGTATQVDGLLAVKLPAGAHRVQLSYHDSLFTLGCVISLLTILALIALTLWTHRRRLSSLLADLRAHSLPSKPA